LQGKIPFKGALFSGFERPLHSTDLRGANYSE
jgi:hypothetical protein